MGGTAEKLFFLSDVRPGETFELKGRRFEKGETRRTRVLCREVSSGKKLKKIMKER